MACRPERIIVPFAGESLIEVVPRLLWSYGFDPEFHKLDDEDGYRQLMQALWSDGETFVIVEHDILPWPGAIDELLACPCEWGTYSYQYHGGIGIAHMLGCAKITTRFMERLPHVWDNPVHWSKIDGHLFFAAREVGQEPHLHRPAVIHLNEKALADAR